MQEDESTAMLQWLSRSVLPDAFPVFRNTEIHACFYPYIGLTHTIRRKDSTWIVRISDHCRQAPKEVLEAILIILASKIAHRKPQRRYLEKYDSFRESPSIAESVRQRRLLKGRKQIADDGMCHSLTDLYHEVNESFFNNQIEISRIGWGLRRSWNRLGHYDPVHHTITLSPVLDSPAVPVHVVRFIVYHEMLHELFERPSSGFFTHHPPEFRRAEQAYPDFAGIKRFLRDYCSRRKFRKKATP